ncbi:hypothetical protein [Agrobacterium cavarae]|uniref:hypothetical protein n=1 Tax=Agrobacterium cavarae TaxID=2528239 RepID=UPI0028A692A6|nr:hypothetical protein [Agrobacterium cavarae]
MATDDLKRRLGPGLLAFHFTGGDGITATELGEFLVAAGRALKPKKIQLQVVGIERGSLSVIFRPITKELKNAPIVTAITVATFLSSSTPVQKVTAQMVNNGSIEKVEIVNQNTNIIIMDKTLALGFDEKKAGSGGEVSPRSTSTALAPLQTRARVQTVEMIKEAVGQALEGNLVGRVFDVEGALYFRPDGRRYLVPVRFGTPELKLEHNARYKVRGDLRTSNGQPDEIFISAATLH